MPKTPSYPHSVIRLNAGNNVNGNPRRLYLIMTGSTILSAYDEGYQGYGALPEEFKASGLAVSDTIATTPAEYRRLLKAYGKTA